MAHAVDADPRESPSTAQDNEAAPVELSDRDAEPVADAPCPRGMTLVQGSYCPDVDHHCLGYLDPPGRYHEFRCRQYTQPAVCLSERIAMRFCIDVREYTPARQTLPRHFVSFQDARRACEESGKRLCRESEWNFACEGEAMLPYPYGFTRDASACHADRTDLWEADGKTVRDQRVPSGQFERCVSPFGVFDMAGNLEEFVERDDAPSQPAMKGAWWLPGRNHCRARQTFHNAAYKGVETGFRCCAEPGVGDDSVTPRDRDRGAVPRPMDGCASFREARGADGGATDCYPYRCRGGRCLKRCKTMQDCAGASRPAEMQEYGWPLECMPSGSCVPMPPSKVNGRRP